MSRKTIFIGNQANDGTGDSIRDAFGKANQNFEELYAVGGLGAGLKFTQSLDDTPKNLINNSILMGSTSSFVSTVTQRVLVASTGISIVLTTSSIVLSNTNSSLFTDADPTLSADLDGNGFRGINFADPVVNQDLATKNYVDNNSFASSINLFVSTSGDDNRVGPRAGRALPYAFKTIGKACQVAEQLVSDPTTLELGPDQKYITYGGGFSATFITTITNSISISGNKEIGVYYTGDGTDAWLQNDIRTGQYIKGMNSGAVGFIDALSNLGNSGVVETYNVEVKSGIFILGESLMYGTPISNVNITIIIESGIYEEDYPIKIPANVSLRATSLDV